MAKEKFPPFKAGERQKATVGKARPAAAAAPPTEARETVGFARIEQLLDQEEPDAVRGRLQQLLDDLDGLHEQSSTAKDRSAAKRARGAVVQTQALLEHLFSTRDRLIAELEKAEEKA